MKTPNTKLPDVSLLNNGMQYDFIDSYEGTLSDPHNHITPTDVGKAFFSSGPKWIEKLFDLRNKIVSVIGLKTSGDLGNREKLIQNFQCEPGEQMGLFKVFAKSADEVILGEDDRHLNFRISLFLESNQNNKLKKSLIISTTVEFNNWFGLLYFLPVRPFHRIIVPTILKSILKDLETAGPFTRTLKHPKFY